MIIKYHFSRPFHNEVCVQAKLPGCQGSSAAVVGVDTTTSHYAVASLLKSFRQKELHFADLMNTASIIILLVVWKPYKSKAPHAVYTRYTELGQLSHV